MSTPDRTEHRLGRAAVSKQDLRRFARQVRKARSAQGQSQSVFAKAVGISNKQLSNIECAQNWPAMPVALKICRLTGIELPKALDK